MCNLKSNTFKFEICVHNSRTKGHTILYAAASTVAACILFPQAPLLLLPAFSSLKSTPGCCLSCSASKTRRSSSISSSPIIHQNRLADKERKKERKERKSWVIKAFNNQYHADRNRKQLKDKSRNLPAGTAEPETCVTLVSTPGRWLDAVSNSRDSDEVSKCMSMSCKKFWPCPDKTVPHRQINNIQFLGICMAGCSPSSRETSPKRWGKSTERADERRNPEELSAWEYTREYKSPKKKPPRIRDYEHLQWRLGSVSGSVSTSST